MRSEWSNFVGGLWESEINVRDFIQKNYKPYDGDESFLVGPTEATEKLWGKLKELQKEERSILKEDKTLPSAFDILLSNIPVQDVWGVGWRLAPKLKAEGIHTAADLARMAACVAAHHMDLDALISAVGVPHEQRGGANLVGEDDDLALVQRGGRLLQTRGLQAGAA